MTTPAVYDLEVYQGDTYEQFFRVKNTTLDAYVDLTGYTIEAQIRAEASSPTVLAEMTVTIANQVTARGGLFLIMPPSLTATLSTTGGVWDLQFTSPAGKVTTYLAGAVTVIEEVTR